MRGHWRWFGAGAATLAVLGVVIWSLSGSDLTPKRWKPPFSIAGYTIRTHESETSSNLYSALVNPSGLPPCGEGTPRPIKGQIPPQHHNWNCPHVSVYSFPAQPSPLITVRDLGDRGQAEAIRFLEQRAAGDGKTLDDIKVALNSPVGQKDPFRFDRVLVATVAKGVAWEPGDRMTWTRIFIQPINFTFAGYAVAQTDNETVKVSSVEATSTRKFDANIESTVPGMKGPKATLGPSGEQSVKSASDINAQYEKLGIDIQPEFLRIIRESETGGDVAGNATVSLTAVTDRMRILKSYPDDTASSGPTLDDIVLLVTALRGDGDTPARDNHASANATEAPAPFDVLPQIPVPHCALWARVWMLYEERKVEAGAESYDESKQTVSIVRDAEDKEDIQIMSADEVSPSVWSLQICDQSKCDDKNPTFLRASVKAVDGTKPGALRKVVFVDYGLAVRFAHWLRIIQEKEPSRSNYTFNYPRSDQTSLQVLRPFRNMAKCGDETEGAED